MTWEELLRQLLPGTGNVIASFALLVGVWTYAANRQDRLRAQINRCAVWLEQDARRQWYLTIANRGDLPLRWVSVQLEDAEGDGQYNCRVPFVPPDARPDYAIAELADFKEPRVRRWNATDSNGRTWNIDALGRAVQQRKNSASLES